MVSPWDTIESAPEKFGLTLIATGESGGAYEFNTSLLFKHGTVFLYAHDSGCSCPLPFEGLGIPDLTMVGSIGELTRLLDANHDQYEPLSAEERATFLADARKAGLK